MKKRGIAAILTLALLCGSFLGVMPAVSAASSGEGHIIDPTDVPLRLYYDEEASHGVAKFENTSESYGSSSNWINANLDDDWERWSIPLGSGYFGANIFGRTETERIQLTDKSLSNPYYVNSISMGGVNNFSETYIDLGHKSSGVTGYRRELDLTTALSTVSYSYGGVTYTREYFTSYPDNAMVIRLDASVAGALDFVLRPTVPYEQAYMNSAGDRGGKTGTVTSAVEGGVGKVVLSGTLEYFDIDFYATYRVYTSGGSVSATTCTNSRGETDGTVTVKGATSAYIIINLGTDYVMTSETFSASTMQKPTFSTTIEDAKKKVEALATSIDKITAGLDYEAKYNLLRSRHVADYSALFGRVSLDLNFNEADLALTTDALLYAYKSGSGSRYLEALYFQYGRYLLIASSRAGALPANLQGTWNRYNKAPWSSGFWHNINVQMNYWPAFSTNLAETFEAYVGYNSAYMAKASSDSASIINRYNSAMLGADGGNGWSIDTGGYVSDVYASTSIGNLGFTTQLFWEYYAYTGDEQILRDVVYPVLVGAARFITKMVREDKDGNYIAFYTDSPEQYYNGVWYYTDKGTAYAQSFAYQNNYNMLLAAKELGIDFSDTSHEDYAIIQRVLSQIDKYDPIRVGYSGQVKEFFEEEYYGDIGEYTHRHISQLVGLYPASVINGTTPAWLDAAKYTLTERGDNATGWGVAHRLTLWARVQDGERAHDLLEQLLRVNTATNLWDLHPPFQIDGNLGGTAGVSEMLLQSHAGYIEPLAAIPAAWDSGSYTGLVARGGFTVAAEWQDGVATCFNITSQGGGEVSVKYSGITASSVTTAGGKRVEYKISGDDLITFDTTEGETYIISGFKKQAKTDPVSNLTLKKEFMTDAVLTWDAVDSAVKYNVYVAHENAPAYTLLASTVGTAYVHSPAAAESNLRTTYAVTAVGVGGIESARTLVYYNPVDTSASVVDCAAAVVDEKVQVTVNANSYASKYRLWEKKADAADYTLLLESGYPILIADYDSTAKYAVSVIGYYGDESEITPVKRFNSASGGTKYNASNILDGLSFIPTASAAADVHGSAYGYPMLTDGIKAESTSFHVGRFSTKTPATTPFCATVTLGDTFMLSELRLYDFNGTDDAVNFLGTAIKIEVQTAIGWKTAYDLTTNAEILAHRVKGQDLVNRHVSFDLSGFTGMAIRITISGSQGGNSISLWEIQCSGLRTPTNTVYKDNVLAGMTPIESNTNGTIINNKYGTYGFDKLTDGSLELHTGRFAISDRSASYATVTYALGSGAALGSLKITDHVEAGDTISRSNETTVELFIDGEWVKVLDSVPLWTDPSVPTPDVGTNASSAAKYVTIDLSGYIASMIRLTFKNTASSKGITLYEIALSGTAVKGEREFVNNAFSGYVFAPSNDTAANSIWMPYTYDRITDGGDVHNTSYRFATGGAHIVDGTLDFDGKIFELYSLTVNYEAFNAKRCGSEIEIQTLYNGKWTTAAKVVHTTERTSEVINLGGALAEQVRVIIPTRFSGGDCTVIHEMKCNGFIRYGLETFENTNSNVLLGMTSQNVSLTNASMHSNPTVSDIAFGFDGSLDTRYAVYDSSGPYTLTIDLGREIPLYTLSIYDWRGLETTTRSDKTDVEILVDGVWITLYRDVPLTVSADHTSFSLYGASATKIRITFENTDGSSRATIYEITCTTGSAAIDRAPLLAAYTALDALSSDEFGFDALKAMRMAELRPILGNVDATADDIAAAIGEIEQATATLRAGMPVDTTAGDFDKYNVSLDGNVGMNFYAEITEDTIKAHPNAFVLLADGEGREEKVYLTALERTSDGKLVLRLDRAAAEMTDEITLRLILGGTACGEVVTTSVATYAKTVIDGEYDTATKDLMRALLHYGAYAQAFFGVNTDNLANSGLDPADLGAVTADNTARITGRASGIAFATWNLSLESEVTAKIYLTLAEGASIDNYRVTVTTPTGESAYADVEYTGDRYRVVIRNIAAGHLNDDYTVTVQSLLDGSETSMTLAATSYTATVLENASAYPAALVDLVRALKAYATAADGI